MNIDSIENGLVLDHITAGMSMEIYHYLHLDRSVLPVGENSCLATRSGSGTKTVSMSGCCPILPMRMRPANMHS